MEVAAAIDLAITAMDLLISMIESFRAVEKLAKLKPTVLALKQTLITLQKQFSNREDILKSIEALEKTTNQLAKKLEDSAKKSNNKFKAGLEIAGKFALSIFNHNDILNFFDKFEKQIEILNLQLGMAKNRIVIDILDGNRLPQTSNSNSKLAAQTQINEPFIWESALTFWISNFGPYTIFVDNDPFFEAIRSNYRTYFNNFNEHLEAFRDFFRGENFVSVHRFRKLLITYGSIDAMLFLVYTLINKHGFIGEKLKPTNENGDYYTRLSPTIENCIEIVSTKDSDNIFRILAHKRTFSCAAANGQYGSIEKLISKLVEMYNLGKPIEIKMRVYGAKQTQKIASKVGPSSICQLDTTLLSAQQRIIQEHFKEKDSEEFNSVINSTTIENMSNMHNICQVAANNLQLESLINIDNGSIL
eukprot:TRINITY_DN3976_c1_g1_i1.p1 TRINITY_DN3976_c1_g1~~TRINITY_DN3976_c1_g1_i1.p1  ORF type:complete len:417 (-),score=137.51 TRINITY_DN3976_c1_g1_i1:1268-2518(-)